MFCCKALGVLPHPLSMYWKEDAAFDIKGIITRKLSTSDQNLSQFVIILTATYF
jgi:hypothetical protein